MFLGGKTEDVMQLRILGISQIWHKLLTWSQVTIIMTPSFFCLLFYFWGIHLFSLDLFWLVAKWKLCINYSFIVNGDGSMVWSRKPWLKPFVLTIICIINITLKVKFHVTKWHLYNWWFFFLLEQFVFTQLKMEDNKVQIQSYNRAETQKQLQTDTIKH